MPVKDNADSKYIWMDGKLVPYAEAQVPFLSHSLHYGTAAFEGIRAYATADGRTAIFRAEEHFKRLFDSIRVLGLACPHSVSDCVRATCETIKANEFEECYIRPLVYLDDSTRGLKLPAEPKVLTSIAAWNWGKYMGADGQKNGVRVMVSTFRRPDVSTTMTHAKLSGGYITSVLARREASKNGFDECLLLDPNGYVAEGSGENVFVAKDGILYTPPPPHILPGITRDSVMQMAAGLGYTVKEVNLTRNQLYLADEIFFTGTAVEVTPIREVDHHSIGSGRPGPITQKLGDLFFRIVRGEVPEYRRWLTYV
jgi:branched-chain amino acid aminotransferase